MYIYDDFYESSFRIFIRITLLNWNDCKSWIYFFCSFLFFFSFNNIENRYCCCSPFHLVWTLTNTYVQTIDEWPMSIAIQGWIEFCRSIHSSQLKRKNDGEAKKKKRTIVFLYVLDSWSKGYCEFSIYCYTTFDNEWNRLTNTKKRSGKKTHRKKNGKLKKSNLKRIKKKLFQQDEEWHSMVKSNREIIRDEWNCFLTIQRMNLVKHTYQQKYRTIFHHILSIFNNNKTYIIFFFRNS